MNSPDPIHAFHAGDPTLFRRIVERHSPGLLALALAYWDDPDRAHDVVQATWIRAFDRRRQLTAWPSLTGWLRAICRNVCRSEGRKAAVRERDLRPCDAPVPLREPADALAEERALQRAVADALAQLPPRQREVVVLRLLDGRSTRECADLLGIAEGTVKATLHHALAALEPLLRSWTDADVP